MKKLLTLWLVMGISVLQSFSQSRPVELFQLCQVEDDTLSVDLLVNNFIDMSSFQFSMNYDGSELDFIEATNFGALGGFGPGMINQTTEAVRAIWSHPFGMTTTLTGYSTIATFKFEILQSPFNSPVITDDPLFIEFTSGLGEQVVNTYLCGELFASRVTGIIEERAGNCTDIVGPLPSHWNLIFTNEVGDTFLAIADENGNYDRFLPEGVYDVTIQNLSDAWTLCTPSPVTIDDQTQNIQLDLGLVKNYDCPNMCVDLYTRFLRRCFENTYTIFYSNQGTADATDAYIELTLDDYMTFVSSSVPEQDLGNQRYRFDLGDVASLEDGRFNMVVLLDCDSTVIGQTHCVKGEAFPDDNCEIVNPSWSGAHVEASAQCDGDSVRLILQNTGTAPMTLDRSFIVVEDDISFMRGSYRLDLAEEQSYAFEANGQTWRIIAEQEPFDPIQGHPTAAIEGCTMIPGDYSTGFVTQFREADYAQNVSISCEESVGSFDPNDKIAYPKGLGDNHEIERNENLDYTIRFQNTGNDTAFNVLIIDTLSEHLDLNTFEVIHSSHAYLLEWRSGRELRISFPNILMPDSTTNEPQSHGFIKYRMNVDGATPLGTEVTNNAEIYFDFNEAVHTNTTLHTLKSIVVTSVHGGSTNTKHDGIKYYPNPTDSYLTLDGSHLPGKEYRFTITDSQGRMIEMGTFEHEQKHTLRMQHLPAGLYYIQITCETHIVDQLSVLLQRG